MQTFEVRLDDRLLTTDKTRIDREWLFAFLSERAYWSPGLPRDVFERALEGSLCFSLWVGDKQLGFARMITDGATFAYLADVVIDESARGQGLGIWMVGTLLSHPDLQGLRRMMLATSDAHGLYARFGFAAPARPHILMEKVDMSRYRQQA